MIGAFRVEDQCVYYTSPWDDERLIARQVRRGPRRFSDSGAPLQPLFLATGVTPTGETYNITGTTEAELYATALHESATWEYDLAARRVRGRLSPARCPISLNPRTASGVLPDTYLAAVHALLVQKPRICTRNLPFAHFQNIFRFEADERVMYEAGLFSQPAARVRAPVLRKNMDDRFELRAEGALSRDPDLLEMRSLMLSINAALADLLLAAINRAADERDRASRVAATEPASTPFEPSVDSGPGAIHDSGPITSPITFSPITLSSPRVTHIVWEPSSGPTAAQVPFRVLEPLPEPTPEPVPESVPEPSTENP